MTKPFTTYLPFPYNEEMEEPIHRDNGKLLSATAVKIKGRIRADKQVHHGD